MLNGLYKVEYGVNDAFGRSIMCMHNGKLLGGNSAFAHLGTYQESGGEILGEVITQSREQCRRADLVAEQHPDRQRRSPLPHPVTP